MQAANFRGDLEKSPMGDGRIASRNGARPYERLPLREPA
jgi:hypothetical protein